MANSEFVVDFPTLGDLIDGWVEAHCVVPDGFHRKSPFRMADWQFWCIANHYRIRDASHKDGPAVWNPRLPLLNQAFVYRRSQFVAPQKALALDTPIATPTGWTTMGDVAVGDLVFDERGEPTRVLSKSPVWLSDTYRVSFSDGASLVACKDHQWWVDRRTPSGTYVEDRVRTADLVGNLVDSHGARKFRVPNARPLNLPEADLPIDPYTLGAWLGDGSSDDGRITGLDREIFAHIEDAGYEVRQMAVAKRVNVIGLMVQLRAAGVLRNKHIPAAYLRGSEKQRWALLQGLMDTDGYCDSRAGKCEFVTVLPALRDGVMELLRSLGVKPVCYPGEAKLYGRVTGPKWRIYFSARSDMPVFHLERKQSRLMAPGRSHAQFGHRRITAVERVDMVPTQCLTVDAASHVFLAGVDMLPTCNTGKGPMAATIACVEGVGPSLFAGWAVQGDEYRCEAFGCGCGWSYAYTPGEPMGMRHPSPLIQLTATSEDQVDNVYRPLTAMIRLGPLNELMKVREGFIRILGNADDPDLDRIDAVTSSANSRVGNPISLAIQDESGLYTASNKMRKIAFDQRRGAAGMGGRTIECTNAWDPSMNSVAQSTFEGRADDVFKFYRQPPKHLSYANKVERRKIHKYVYEGSWWVDLDSIEAEAAEIMETDPAQAERFFGNRVVAGSRTWLDMAKWDEKLSPRVVPPGTKIALGFDGSDVDDWTGIRAETLDGYQFTPVLKSGRPTFWDPRATPTGRIPHLEVMAAFDELQNTYDVVREYWDPPFWTTEMEDRQATRGKRCVAFHTGSIPRIWAALEQFKADVHGPESRLTHDDCEQTMFHLRNAVERPRNNQQYILGKASDNQKIDLAMSSVLAHKAACDAVASGENVPAKANYIYM